MSEDTRVLRENIRDTRERMSNTLDELGERLNPNRLKQQAKDSIRDATVGRVTNMASNARYTVMDTIRDNPIPAAMVGIGLGWMLFNGRRSHDLDRYRERHGLPYQGDLGAETPRLRQDDAAGGIGASTSPADDAGTLRRATNRVSETVDDVRERVTERVDDVRERAQHVAHDVADTTRYQAHRLEDRFQTTLQDNPLAIGVAAAAVGLAVGLAIPESRREAQVMGSARDRLMDRVRDTAEDVGEKVQRVAERAVSEAEEGARDEGLR